MPSGVRSIANYRLRGLLLPQSLADDINQLNLRLGVGLNVELERGKVLMATESHAVLQAAAYRAN